MNTDQRRVRDIVDGESLIAQIYDLNCEGEVIFPTNEEAEMQCGFGEITTPKTIAPHIHNDLHRKVSNTSEFFLIMQGSVVVTFYSQKGEELGVETLTAGMGFLQFIGGHGFEFAANTKYIELKQGPYYGNQKDKTPLSEF